VILEVTVLNDTGDEVEVQFSVRDSGIGIPADRISKIFDSFEQVDDDTTQKFGGTGLGLSIVKKLTELKGGTLKVESEVERGSTFSFTNTYRVISREVIAEKKTVESELPKFEDVHVLLAEDNLINQFMIKKILGNWNITVDAVEDGEMVLQKLKSKHYDLILMDTHMPVMGGHESMQLIRQGVIAGKADIPIISLSANVMEEETRAATAAGATAIISKPIDLAALHRTIGH
jgi:CheY-like chemotaxis protein